MASTFYRVTKENFELDPACRVVKASQYMVLCQAESLLDEARERAGMIVAQAEKQAEEIKEKGYQDGLAQGKLEMSEQMILNVANTVNYFESIERRVVHIVMEAVNKVMGSIPSEELIVSVVKNALAAKRNQKQITVRVSPEELDTVRGKLGEITAEFPSISFVEVESDARLSKGGCILESEIGTVDASIDVQLEALRRAVVKVFKPREK